MPKIKNSFNGSLAEKLIEELGGVNQVSKICKIATSSVCAWKKNGVPNSRVMYLKLAYPSLRVWKLHGNDC